MTMGFGIMENRVNTGGNLVSVTLSLIDPTTGDDIATAKWDEDASTGEPVPIKATLRAEGIHHGVVLSHSIVRWFESPSWMQDGAWRGYHDLLERAAQVGK